MGLQLTAVLVIVTIDPLANLYILASSSAILALFHNAALDKFWENLDIIYKNDQKKNLFFQLSILDHCLSEKLTDF